MQPPEILALCAEIVPGAGAVQVQFLSRGLVNESYRVTRQRIDYCLRVAVADGRLIALDRAWEAQLLQVAAAADLAPDLRFGDVGRGILLSDWLPGGSWRERSAGDPAAILAIAELLKRVHALSVPQPPHPMNPTAWVEHYESCGSHALARRPAATRHLEEWAQLADVESVVCHGDLHALNLVQSGNSLRLIDWEYAHVADAFWDLAGWCANGDLDASARRHLLTCYLGRAPSSQQWRRLELLRWLYDYVCLQWSWLYLSSQPAGPAAAAIAKRSACLDARLSFPAH